MRRWTGKCQGNRLIQRRVLRIRKELEVELSKIFIIEAKFKGTPKISVI